MNFKKTLTVASLASLAIVGLASCGSDEKAPKAEVFEDGYTAPDTTELNLSLTYNGMAYLKYNREKKSMYNGKTTDDDAKVVAMDGKELKAGETILPVWQKMQTKIGFKLVDATLSASDTTNMMRQTILSNYVGINGTKVDLLQVMSGAAEYIEAVNNKDFVNLSTYMNSGMLPNLKKFMDESPAVHEEMKMGTGVNKGVYFSPYFDGIDQLEKCFNMNIEAVAALLDDNVEQYTGPKETVKDNKTTYDYSYGTGNRFKKAAAYDTAATLKETAYTTPYIKSLSQQEIAVAKKTANGYEKATIKVSFTEAQNVIAQQNALTTKNGKALTDTLKAYIDTVYGEYIGEGKIFANRSEIFTSASACYNADELVALLRCIKTNPAYLTGSASSNMVPFFPRTGEANRVRAFFEIGQMFGLRGSFSGENDLLWYNEAGELVDGRTQEYTYAVMEKLNTLQKEGLFPDQWVYTAGSGGTEFRSNTMAAGTGFMCYDYSNVTSFNRSSQNNAVQTDQMEPILAPVAKWPISKDGSGATLTGYNATEKVTYTRFSEDNRSLKNGGWSIVAKNVKGNKEKLFKALKLVDYMYSEEGSFLEAFGTTGAEKDGYTDFDPATETKGIVTDSEGVRYPKLSAAYVERIKTYGKGTWHNYMTRFEGSCFGIGNIRSNYLEAQNTNPRQEKGMDKIAAATGTGAMYQCLTTGKAFYKSVPTTIALTENQTEAIKTGAKPMTDFWNMANNSTSKIGEGQAFNLIRLGWTGTTPNTLKAVTDNFGDSNKTYLKFYAKQIGVTAATTNQYNYFAPTYMSK